MIKTLQTIIVTMAMTLLSVSAHSEDSYTLPTDIFLEVSTGPKGQPLLSASEFKLKSGRYYRFNFVCPDVEGDTAGFQFKATDLVANSHIRVFSVGNIELYLQGQTFRAIQCDEAGSARFSFYPMAKGDYEIAVSVSYSDPPQQALARVVVE